MSVAIGRIGAAAVLGVLVGAAITVGLVVTDNGGHPVADPHGGKAAADYAESLLDRIPLPRGARSFAGARTDGVGGPPLSTTFDSKVFRHREYRLPAPPDAVLAAIKARGIAGFQLSGSGAGGPVVGPPTMTYDVYDERRPPSGIYLSDLTLSTLADGPHASLLRVDAQVVWRQLRTAAEDVPASARVVTIARTILPQPGQVPTPTGARILTDPATVGTLIRIVNGLPTMPSGGQSTAPAQCPAVHLEVQFATTTPTRPDVVVETDPECSARTWGVTARDQHEPALSDRDGAFLAAVMAALQS